MPFIGSVNEGTRLTNANKAATKIYKAAFTINVKLDLELKVRVSDKIILQTYIGLMLFLYFY